MQQDLFGSDSICPISSDDVLKATDPNFESWRERIVQDALKIVEQIPKWKHLGNHDGVALYEKAPAYTGHTWYGRVSKHTRSLKTFKVSSYKCWIVVCKMVPKFTSVYTTYWRL